MLNYYVKFDEKNNTILKKNILKRKAGQMMAWLTVRN
jgi:hypothetical protein